MPSSEAIETADQIIESEFGFRPSEMPGKKASRATDKTSKDIKENGENIIPVSYYEDQDYILEQIKPIIVATRATRATHSRAEGYKEKYKYIIYTKADKTIGEIDEFVVDNRTYRPIEGKMVEKNSVLLPSGIEEYGTTKELIKEISDYLLEYFEPPKFFEKFLPYYVLFTWVYQRFPFIAYLHFVGLTGTGKTIAAETLSSLCYKPIDAAGSVTIASIFRLADQWKGTLFLDEFDLSSFGQEGYHAVVTFLKTGVSDRTILRVEGEKKKEVEAFAVKSPKIFTSEQPITDAGLQSRTFVIKMEKNKKRLPLYKLSSYYEKGLKLRNKLLLWRLHNLNAIDLKEIEYGVEELKGFDRRVQQIITPIYYLSDEDTRKDILEFAKVQEDETYRERRESNEGQVYQIIADLYPATITLGQIFEKFNKGRKFEFTEKKLANLIRKILNFDIERVGHDNVSTLIIDEDRLKELGEYFGSQALERVARHASVADTITPQDDKLYETAEEIFSETQTKMV